MPSPVLQNIYVDIECNIKKPNQCDSDLPLIRYFTVRENLYPKVPETTADVPYRGKLKLAPAVRQTTVPKDYLSTGDSEVEGCVLRPSRKQETRQGYICFVAHGFAFDFPPIRLYTPSIPWHRRRLWPVKNIVW